MKLKQYVDVDAIFDPHPVTADVITRTNERAIKFAVKSLVLTNVFERPFHSELSSPVRGLLFNNFSNNFEIVLKEAIAQLISQFEPRVNLLDIKVYPSYDNNNVYIVIQFVVKHTADVLTVDLTLNRTR